MQALRGFHLLTALLPFSLLGCSSLTSVSSDEEPIWMQMAREGHVTSVKQYADDLNQRSIDGLYPLESAYLEKDRLAFGTLLKAGASPDITFKDGSALICQAAKDLDPFYLRALISYEAALSLPAPLSDDRPNAAFCAAEVGRIQNVRLLLNHGVDDTVRNSKSQTLWDLEGRRTSTSVITPLSLDY